MNELLALGVVAAYLAIGYLLIYPRAKSISTLRIIDFGLGLLTLATTGAIFFTTDPVFQLIWFETNWFIFTLVVMVLLETPLWYWYMKTHPQLGTLAELYGLTSNSKKLAKNIDSVMRDTKWDGLRTAKAQRVLVVLGVLSLIASPVVFWFEDFIKPGIGIVTIVPIFIIWWLLRISVRLVADAPDEYLDEFQLRQRDRTYLEAFRILATIVSFAAVALMLYVFSIDVVTEANVEYYMLKLTFGQVNALIWLVLGSVILVPNLVLAWNQAKRVRT